MDQKEETMDTETTTTTTPATSKPVAAKPAAKKPAKKGVKKGKLTSKNTKSGRAVKKPAKRKTAPKKKVAAKKSAAKKTAAATARAPRLSGIPNKAEFIRSLPGLPAKEVVARAKELGAVLTESYVYNTRGLQKNGGKGKKTTTVRKAPLEQAGLPAVHAGLAPASVEELFFAVVAEIGTVKCVHMLMASHGLVESALRGVRG
jgi:hypothetical protein